MREQKILIKLDKERMLTEKLAIIYLQGKFDPEKIVPQDHSDKFYVFALYGKGIVKKFKSLNS